MKDNSLRKLLYMASILLLAAVVFVSCKKDDDDDDDPILVEDGFYVKGAGTALTDLDFKGLMNSTRNEVEQEARTSLMELFVAVKAGTDGFNIVEVAGQTTKTYGPGSDFGVIAEADRIGDEPKMDFWRGSYTETATKFTVPTDGLYHVVIDTEVGTVAVIPVAYWGLIGAATPGGWSDDTQLPSKGFDLNSMTFELTNVPMTRADYKFRYSSGWKVVIDGEDVRVNTNFGGSPAVLVPGGDNIANDESGLYTAKMVWTLGEGYTANMERTGDLDVFDYTDTELGLVGSGILVDGVEHNWDDPIQLQKPEVLSDTEYEWTFTGIEVAAGDPGFKIRDEKTDWSGLSFGYPQVTMAGLAADNFETNNDGNFVPKEAGTFDIVFKIDALNEVLTFTVNPAGAAPELYMLGDGTPAGWDNTAALPLQGTDGNYTITSELPGGGYIKFITVLGQWAPQYGTNAEGTSTGGVLVYRETESVPDPPGIPGPDDAGTYVITVDTNELTYTIVPADE